jgi:hypothetical protein
MKIFSYFFIFFLMVSKTFGSPPQESQVLKVRSDGKEFTFFCGLNSEIKVISGNGQEDAGAVVIDQKLDESESCDGAVWTKSQSTGAETILVMINPGRTGVNAQMNVYALQHGVASFAGYLPVGADDLGGLKYSFDSDQADGVWREVYGISDGKVKRLGEIQFMQSGSVCVDRSGNVSNGAQCAGKRITASAGRPLCISYVGKIGKISPASKCSELAKNFSN